MRRGGPSEPINVPFPRLSFALANTAAVLASLYIAFAFDLDRPYWAMFTVFIVANPICGAVRSKAVYRFLGTFLGAAVSLLLIPPLVDAPVLLCLAISLWVAVCVYLSLLDRTPRSYLFLLAGYTATLVGLAVVNTPEKIFDTAVSRVEEIFIGLICAAIAHSVIFPQSVTTLLTRKIQVTLRSAGAWLAESLMCARRPADLHSQQQLAAVVTDLHLLYTHVAFETSDVPRSRGVMRALQQRLALLLPCYSGVQKSVAALAADGQVPDSVARPLEAASHWLRCGEVTEGGCSRQSPSFVEVESAIAVDNQHHNPLGLRGLLEQNALTNLRKLMAAFVDAKLLAAALMDDRLKLPLHLQQETVAARRVTLYRDRGLALLSAFAAAGATLLACLLWIEGSWPEGAVAAQFAAIGCSLAATLDDPSKLMRSATIGILVALPFAALYEFAILPQVDGFVSLALVLAPAIFLFSLMQSSERLGGAGLVLAIAFSGGLALQSTYRADFAAFVNSNSAEIVGLLVAIAMSLVFRTVDPSWNALRISRSGRKAVSRLAAGRKFDLRAWTIQMFDRLGLVTSRIATTDRSSSPSDKIDGLRDLRVGLNIAILRDVGGDFSAASRSALHRVLNTVSSAYSSGFGNDPAGPDIEEAIDLGITSLGAEPPSRTVTDGLAALIGLRLDLAPAVISHAIAEPL